MTLLLHFTIGWFVDKLVAGPADKTDPRLDLFNANLKNLRPVIIINAEIDPLRSDGEMLETALKEADVDVTRKVTHEFFGTAAAVGKAKDAQEYAGKHLKKYFKKSKLRVAAAPAATVTLDRTRSGLSFAKE